MYLDSFQYAIDIINNNISKRDSGGKVRFIYENRDEIEKALCKINKTILLFAQSHSNIFKKLEEEKMNKILLEKSIDERQKLDERFERLEINLIKRIKENSESQKIETLVHALLEPFFLDRGHHIFMDNFYNSVRLSQKLLKRKTHTTGTLRRNRKKS